MTDADIVPPVVFVRYNCDAYTIDSEKPIGGNFKRRNNESKLMEYLKSVVDGERTYTQTLNIVYICYDTTDGVSDVLSDPDYSEQMKACVRECIV